MLLEEACKIALRAKAEIVRNRADIGFVFAQLADRRFHTQSICIKPRADSYATLEEVIEMGA